MIKLKKFITLEEFETLRKSTLISNINISTSENRSTTDIKAEISYTMHYDQKVHSSMIEHFSTELFNYLKLIEPKLIQEEIDIIFNCYYSVKYNNIVKAATLKKAIEIFKNCDVKFPELPDHIVKELQII